nr:uncharacterized mitochondrial protein AtMg00810-like [Tanacetum cinerariifolium]
MLIFYRAPLFLWAEAIATACFTQNCTIIHRHFNKTPYELINGRKPDILFLHVFGALCYPKNNRKDIGKLGAKGDIGFFIGSGLDLTYAPSTITKLQPTEGELDLLFEAMYDDYFGGQPSASVVNVSPVQEPQVYVDDIIFGSTHPRNPEKYRMESCDPVSTPMEIKDKIDLDQNETPVDATKYHSMIGALMYLTSSRPDIVHATCLCARYQTKPTAKHLKEVKRIFCYLRGTANTGLWYTKDSGFELTGFLDADYAGCKDTFKSTSGGAQFLGEKLVSWSSKKQDCTTLSTAEAEYVSLSACCAQVFWMRTPLTDYGFHFNKILIYYDPKSAIAISCNPVQHSRTKHIAVRYHFIKKHVEKGEKLVSWSSKKQDCTGLSTAEAEYVSLSACCAQVLWIRTQLTDYGFNFTKIPIYCDSKSAIAISCNPEVLPKLNLPGHRYSIHTVKRSSRNRRIRRRRYNITPAESKFKTPCSIIKDKYMMKAQQAFKFSSMRMATQESQGGMRFKDNDLKIKIQAHRRANNVSKEFPRTQGSKFKEGFILNDHPSGGDS